MRKTGVPPTPLRRKVAMLLIIGSSDDRGHDAYEGARLSMKMIRNNLLLSTRYWEEGIGVSRNFSMEPTMYLKINGLGPRPIFYSPYLIQNIRSSETRNV